MIKVNIFSNKVIKQAGKLCAYFSCLSIMCLFSVASYGSSDLDPPNKSVCDGKFTTGGVLKLDYGGILSCSYQMNWQDRTFTLISNSSTKPLYGMQCPSSYEINDGFNFQQAQKEYGIPEGYLRSVTFLHAPPDNSVLTYSLWCHTLPACGTNLTISFGGVLSGNPMMRVKNTVDYKQCTEN